jgi:hypothetical protein
MAAKQQQRQRAEKQTLEIHSWGAVETEERQTLISGEL